MCRQATRRLHLHTLGLLAACLACSSPPESSQPASPHAGKAGTCAGQTEQASPLSRARQLTFAGRRSGEGYFSKDGSQLVLQSEREEGNPFYQIYLMDMGSGEVERISPGFGKTTCGWIHPGGARVLFASSHLDPEARSKQEREIEERESGTQRRYSWDYDEHYDLFAGNLEDIRAARKAGGSGARALQPLSSSPGYDAEASWSPDGRSIVFASNRAAYGAAKLDHAARAKLESDPAYFVDLYIMDWKGEKLRRLTSTPGYDGGPFFSPDGRRIVWRRFAEDGERAEIFSMAIDGSDVRQLTELGALSWAPFYHPSGDYIVFSTSLHGFDNFELYMVDAMGGGDPVRVSESEGFDSLPAFAPDGTTLVWTRRAAAAGGSQLFIAEWDDAEARRLLGLPQRGGGGAPSLLPLPARSSPQIRSSDLRAHVEALSSPVTEGRLTGTPGERIATSYVARVFRSLGLEPAGDEGSYFQGFGFSAGVSLGADNALRLAGSSSDESDPGESFEVDRDWRPFAFSQVGEIEAAEVVFAGYGIVAPAIEGQSAVDSFEGLDLAGRWVLVLRYVPEDVEPALRRHLRRHASLRHKAMVARDRGARGLLVASGPNSKVRHELVPLSHDVSLASMSLAAVSVSDEVAERLLAASGQRLDELQDALDSGAHVPGFAIEGSRLAGRIDLVQQQRRGRNVLGRLVVGDEPSKAVVVLGAHVDHLGQGKGSSSMARGEEKGQIHPGADDNASGVAALLEMAEYAADGVRRGRADDSTPALRRDIVFAAWSGEEIGLLGSSHYVKELADPNSPHARLGDEVIANLNLDMVGRLRDSLQIMGMGSSKVWPGEIERANVPVGLPISPGEDSYLPTDSTPFYLAGVPVLSAFTGAHAEYHTPRDTPDRLDFDGIRGTAELFVAIAESLAASELAPDYVASTAPSSEPRVDLRVYLGTIPDYSQSSEKGLLLAGVAGGGPADKAGLRAGDIVVEIDERTIENIYDYTYALDALEIGVPAEFVVKRGGERLKLAVTPGSRD